MKNMNHTLYFVGAGLTKSLQLVKTVPMMNDFISVMADYLEEDDIILTTLTQWDVPPSAYRYQPPGIVKLAESLAKPSSRTLEGLTRFKRALKNRPAEGVEELLQNSLEDPRSSEKASVRFRYGINRVFEKIGWDVKLAPLLQFLDALMTRQGSHSFVSFNYDLVLDYAISKTLPDADLKVFYGLAKTDTSQRVRLLKPHGSLNFIGTLTDPYVHTRFGLSFNPGVAIEIPGGTLKKIQYYNRSPPPPDKEPCIVPPVDSKLEALRTLGLDFLLGVRELEKQALKSADSVYVIGWSIPATDRDQRTMIREAFKDNKIKELVVVNFGASVDYFDSVADLFGVQSREVKIFNAGFLNFVQQMNL